MISSYFSSYGVTRLSFYRQFASLSSPELLLFHVIANYPSGSVAKAAARGGGGEREL